MSHFNDVFKECRRSVLSNDFQLAIQDWLRRPTLDSFGNVEEVLTFLNKRFNHACIGGVRRQNTILKEILSTHQDGSVSMGLEPLLLVIFQPALQKIFRKYNLVGIEEDELGQVIFSSFLDVINKYPFSEKPERIASKIVGYTKRKVYGWVSKETLKFDIEIPEEETNELACGLKQEDAVISLLDLASGFGYDEDTDHLSHKISCLHKSGKIGDMEKKILMGRYVYQKSLKDLVPENEYQKWKKKIQRIIKKI